MRPIWFLAPHVELEESGWERGGERPPRPPPLQFFSSPQSFLLNSFNMAPEIELASVSSSLNFPPCHKTSLRHNRAITKWCLEVCFPEQTTVSIISKQCEAGYSHVYNFCCSRRSKTTYILIVILVTFVEKRHKSPTAHKKRHMYVGGGGWRLWRFSGKSWGRNR